MVIDAVKKCWCSCFSERVMRHRLDNNMSTTGLKMAVIIQVLPFTNINGTVHAGHNVCLKAIITFIFLANGIDKPITIPSFFFC